MDKNIALPESVSSRTEFKRKFSLMEIYYGTVFAPRAISKTIKNNRIKLVDKNFLKRLELAVTEVNGCAICSYAHAKMALRQGMENEEINSFLTGGDNFIQVKEAKAILFAQHFADSKGFPKVYAYDAIVKEYGKEEAQIILSAVQVMIVGNMYGIPLSAFLSRLKGNPYLDSSLFYELKMQIISFLFLPIAIIHGFFRGLIGLPNTRFDKSE
jgi:AhpD family alkylhydroperoxidase